MKHIPLIMRCLLLILLGSAFFSCTRNPYSDTNRMHKKLVKDYMRSLKAFPVAQDSVSPGDYRVGTTNFNLRKPNFVVIHHTAQESTEQTLRTFTEPASSVSAHYVIGSDGKVYQMLNDYFRAWHGGVGKWGNTTDLNSASIGIELDNDGKEPFDEAQIQSLLKLLAGLKRDYKIPAENFIGHSDIAPVRKVDPGPQFPWERLAAQGYGLWPDEDFFAADLGRDSTLLVESIAVLNEIAIPENLIPIDRTAVREQLASHMLNVLPVREALRIIGYDTADLPAAIRAFKLHFIQKDVHSPLTGEDKKVLYNVYMKSM